MKDLSEKEGLLDDNCLYSSSSSSSPIAGLVCLASKEVISTDAAPGAVGPYSQAIKSGGCLYVSGCIPLVPGVSSRKKRFLEMFILGAVCVTTPPWPYPNLSMYLCHLTHKWYLFLFMFLFLFLVLKTKEFNSEEVEAQTDQALKNMGEVLKAGGCSYDDVVKTTVLLADMKDFAAVNGVYSKYFSSNPPARSAFAVRELPLGAKIEIECIASCD